MTFVFIKLVLFLGFHPAIHGAGIADGTRIVAMNGNLMTLSKPASSATGP